MQTIQSEKTFDRPLLISQFINPADEVIEDSPDEVIEAIIERYAESPNDNDSDSSDAGEQEDVAPVLYSDVIKALETLTLYEQ